MIGMAVLVALHAVSLGASLVLVWRNKQDRLILGEAVALAAPFPVLGPVAAWWLLGRGPREATWKDDSPIPDAPPPAELDPRAALMREMSVQPLSDRMREGDRETRQAAAKALADLGDARAVRVLEGALDDPNPDTRLFASIALVKLEATFAERLAVAREQQEPIRLARAVRGYLGSGLPQGAVARELWGELEKAGLAATGGSAARAAEGWIHVAAARRALEKYGEAREAAEHALTLVPQPAAALELCEAIWASGAVEDLPEAAARMAALCAPASPAHQAAKFWLPS